MVLPKVVIFGANGFIGHHLIRRLLSSKTYDVHGIDLSSDRLEEFLGEEGFSFSQIDIEAGVSPVLDAIESSEVVVPLVAIANPLSYVRQPLRVFELDFEANLPIVRGCARFKKFLLFPSTSEVYGMSQDGDFDPDNSNLVMGPIDKQRWIYAASKQLMDRVIYAYGYEQELDYAIFRPFNWFGTGLDSVDTPREGGSRVVTNFLGSLLRGENLVLVNGGTQRRSFTYIDDGIDALLRIIENREGLANRQIFNIGNPNNDYTIRELAEMMISLARPGLENRWNSVSPTLIIESENDFYGSGYQDVQHRRPNIEKTTRLLGWHPRVDMRDGLNRVISHYIADSSPHKKV